MLRFIRLVGVSVVVLPSLAIACATEAPPAEVLGSAFELRLFSGAPLPFRYSEQGPGTFYELWGDVLAFDSPDSVTGTAWVRRVSAAEALDTTIVSTSRAAYFVDKTTLTISYPCCSGLRCVGPQPLCPATDVGVVRRDTIVLVRDWDVRRPTMVYVRSTNRPTLSNQRLLLPARPGS